MARIKDLEIYPTCDIHLLIEGAISKKMKVTVRDYISQTNLTNKTRTKFLDFEQSIVDTISTKGTFIAKSVGVTEGRIQYTDKKNGEDDIVIEVLVRVKVHNSIENIELGNNQITIHNGLDNYVISVYAEFDDNTIGDISSHPYLNFNLKNASDSSKLFVNNTSDKGRLKGKKQTLGTAVEKIPVEVKYKNMTKEVSVVVRERITKKRPIVEAVFGTGNVRKRRNMLFLSEGFGKSERQVFDAFVEAITDSFFNSINNSPFDILKDNFNVFKVFEPSPERGISVGLPVNSVGKNKKYIKGDVNSEINNQILQAKDSFFGMIYSGRYGDRDSERIESSPLKPEDWYANDAFHLIIEDRRRMPKNWSYSSFLQDYLESLEEIKGVQFINTEINKSNNPWLSNKKDQNLICFLINHNRDGGTRSSNGLKVSVLDELVFNNVQIDFTKNGFLNHEPPELKWNMNVIDPGDGGDLSISFDILNVTKNKPVNTDIITSIVAHEFGHAFELGDEYEVAGIKDLDKNDKSTQDSIDKDLNMTHIWKIGESQVNGTTDRSKLDVKKVSWESWYRNDTASEILKNGTAINSKKIKIKVTKIEEGKWFLNQFDVVPGFENVYIRSRNLNKDNGKPTYLIGPLKIEKVKDDGTITLSSSSNIDVSKIKKKDVIFTPKKENATDLKVIHPKVLSHLTNEKKPLNFDADKCNKKSTSPAFASEIKEFEPDDSSLVVGLFEGGNDHNCKVYRPSGDCRMRSSNLGFTTEFNLDNDSVKKVLEFVPFCHVCQYTIVNNVNPSRFSTLDSYNYPKYKIKKP